MNIAYIFYIIFVIIVCLIIGFFILVLMGNLLAMKFLAKYGLAVFSHKIETDCKLLNYVNSEGACWLSIPEICYSPVMYSNKGKYKNHNFLQKQNKYGELFISENQRADLLHEFALKTDYKISDLSIIKGSPLGNGTDLRHANFSLLRKIKYHIKDGTIINLCEDGKIRKFKAVSLMEMGLDNNFTFKYTNRDEFIKSVLFLSQISVIKNVPKMPVIFLECKTDIDIVFVMCVEVESGDKK